MNKDITVGDFCGIFDALGKTPGLSDAEITITGADGTAYTVRTGRRAGAAFTSTRGANVRITAGSGSIAFYVNDAYVGGVDTNAPLALSKIAVDPRLAEIAGTVYDVIKAHIEAGAKGVAAARQRLIDSI
jgi:hypothetical protein